MVKHPDSRLLAAGSVASGATEAADKGGFPKIRGTIFGGPHNKDYSMLGSILGSPYFGKLPNEVPTFTLQWS